MEVDGRGHRLGSGRTLEKVRCALCNANLPDVIAPGFVGERRAPLGECLPGFAFVRRSALPTLFEYLVCMERKAPFEVVDALTPSLIGFDELSIGNCGKGSWVARRQWPTEAIARSLAGRGHVWEY